MNFSLDEMNAFTSTHDEPKRRGYQAPGQNPTGVKLPPAVLAKKKSRRKTARRSRRVNRGGRR